MRYLIIVLSMLIGLVTSAAAQFSISIGLPGVSIGVNLPVFPELVRVPGYPVYYAPRLQANFFFYDGLYWVYQDDNWYASSWYNGPWGLVAPEAVPLFVLRIPVRYYRSPPPYFRGWQPDAPPRWGEHWGQAWEQHRRGWDQWSHRSAPAPAPLPTYQRRYSESRYPQLEQQQVLRSQNYRYQPRDAVVRQYFQEQTPRRAPPPPQREQRGPEPVQRQTHPAPAAQEQRRQPAPAVAPREQRPPAVSKPKEGPQDRRQSQEKQRKQEQDKDREKDDERGRGPRP